MTTNNFESFFCCCCSFLSIYRKTDRKISYDQFRHALVMCAEEKYPTDPSGLKKLERKIVDGAGPASSSTVSTHVVWE